MDLIELTDAEIAPQSAEAAEHWLQRYQEANRTNEALRLENLLLRQASEIYEANSAELGKIFAALMAAGRIRADRSVAETVSEMAGDITALVKAIGPAGD